MYYYNLHRIGGGNQEDIDVGIEGAKQVGGLSRALCRVMRTCVEMGKLPGCGEIYVGRAGATSRNVYSRWKEHRDKKGHRRGAIALTADSQDIIEWEDAITALMSELAKIGVPTANQRGGGGSSPSAERSCIYVTAGPCRSTMPRRIDERQMMTVLEALRCRIGAGTLEKARRIYNAGAGVILSPYERAAPADTYGGGEVGEEPYHEGHCIRCGEVIDHDPERPLCLDCYRSWKEYRNAEYGEKFCHSCGEKSRTTFAKPECRACYRSNA